MNRSIIMSWSKQTVKVGKTGANDAMATTLTEIDGIKDKSTTLSYSDGETLEMYATGHELVGKEVSDGSYEVTIRVIEPSFQILKMFGITDAADAATEAQITTHQVSDFWSLEVEPKNVGGKGIRAPKCSVTYTPGFSEEEGHYADFTFAVLQGAANYWYKVFTKQAAQS